MPIPGTPRADRASSTVRVAAIDGAGREAPVARRRGGRREAILDAAVTLAADRGVEGFRLDEVAAAAGVAKATLFRWFANRATLLAALEAERGVIGIPDALGRRERVIAEATRLVGMQGVHATTMEQVASAAGISTPTLYWHFASKAALAEAVVRAASPRPDIERFFREEATGDLRADLIALVHLVVGIGPRALLVQRIASDRRGEDDPLRDHVLAEVAMPVWSLLGTYLEGHAARGNLRPAPVMPRVLAFGGMVLTAALARATFGGRVVDDLGAFADAFVTTFLEGEASPGYRHVLAVRGRPGRRD